MIPASFDYVRPSTLDEALGLLAKHGDDAKVLAGGHSLIPAMKLRLSQPKVVVDIGRIGDLRSISERDGKIAIGALTTHYDIESSGLLARSCPVLPEVAGNIGDVQVRNKGTIGGSCVHADPESLLRGVELLPTTIAAAALKAADGVDPLSDIHASGEFRAHLACVQTKRALELATSRG
jgi:aerobic carbon-monoxide dehydrogenase medium subunit